MTCKRGFLGIGACALILLGLSTNASANVTGMGCIITTLAGQTAPLSVANGGTVNTIGSVANFLTACTAANGGAATTNFTFNAPDNVVVAASTSPPIGAATVNQILNNAATNVVCTSAAAVCNTIATAGAAGSSVGPISSWFLFQYQLGAVPAGGLALNVPSHDDGVSLYVNGVNLSPTGPGVPRTALQAASPQGIGNADNFTIPATASGQIVDFIWDECCGNPGVLTVNLPGEAPTGVPEPASIFLLGGLLFGVGTKLRRRVGLN